MGLELGQYVAWVSLGEFHRGSTSKNVDILGISCGNIRGYNIHWIGLRENRQETMVLTIKYWAFL